MRAGSAGTFMINDGHFGFEGACQCTFTEGGFFGGKKGAEDCLAFSYFSILELTTHTSMCVDIEEACFSLP